VEIPAPARPTRAPSATAGRGIRIRGFPTWWAAGAVGW